MRLLVRQFDALVGYLESTPDRGVVFRYDEGYLASPEARPLSHFLPLRDRPYSQAASMPFFSGMLPDGEQRRRVATYLHLSETSALKLLEALGGECAGTVSLFREQDDGETTAPGYVELTMGELESLIIEAERRPLLAPSGGARLSLAGAQDKIPLYRHEGRWFRPIGGAPSSHILKPSSPAYPDLAANEFIVMSLAADLGLPVAPVELTIIGRQTLIVERYDRRRQPDGSIARIHQEDSCQALGIMPEEKYEADGGPGFAAIARIIRETCALPLKGIEALIDIALFNYLAGNCDAHGKNFSFLYREDGVELAPFYDLVSTTAYHELSTKLSMRIGTDYDIERIRRNDLEAFARDIGVKPALVYSKLDSLGQNGARVWDSISSHSELREHMDLVSSIRRGWNERIMRTL